MDKQLLKQGAIKFFAGMMIVACLIFLPAGTLHFGNGWLFLGLLFVPMLLLGIVLLKKDPELLRKRLNNKETEAQQKGVVAFSGLLFLVGFISAGLQYRFTQSTLPAWVTVIAAVVFLLGYVMYAEVMRENSYLSRTVEVQDGQKVIDTGLYGIIRHPMYTATILMFLSVPLILGSWVSFLIFLLYPAALIVRIGNEEKVLEQGLPGYTAYKQKVKYRLIPFIF